MVLAILLGGIFGLLVAGVVLIGLIFLALAVMQARARETRLMDA